MVHNQRVALCVASPHFFPTHGGATLRFLNYFPGLRSRRIYSRVIAGTPKATKFTMSHITEEWNKYSIGDVLPEEEYKGTSIMRISLPDESGWQRTIIFNQAILRFCRQSDYQPDVVQLLSSLPPKTFPWLVRLRRLGYPIVYAYTSPPKLPSTPFKRAKRRLAYRILYRQLDCIVVQSTAMRDLLLDLGVRSRIEIIPNGVDLQRFHPSNGSDESRVLRESLGIREKDKMITLVGSVTPTKGADLLLEAWAKLVQNFPDIHLVVVGALFDINHPKRGEFRHKIEDLVVASGAPDRVHFTGYVQNVEDYLRSSDVFAFPSMKEAMPNSVLEAMASGVPVILTPFDGLPKEFGKPGQEYLMAQRSPDSLAATIADLLQHDEQRKNLGRQGRHWVENTMDIERSLDRYAALYHQLSARAYRRHWTPWLKN